MKRLNLIMIGLLLVILSAPLPVNGQEEERAASMIFVDETTSFELSMRVQGLVNGLKRQPGLKVKAKVVQVEDPTENPLTGEEDLAADVIIIVPPTIETGLVKQVWIVTRPFTDLPVGERKVATEQLDQLKSAIVRAFGEDVTPVGVNDDVIPAYFSTLFIRQGVLR